MFSIFLGWLSGLLGPTNSGFFLGLPLDFRSLGTGAIGLDSPSLSKLSISSLNGYTHQLTEGLTALR